jgi:single-strand DNA-binding protein
MDSNVFWARGNLVADPFQRMVASGAKVTNFRLASNTSRRDPATNEWVTTETLFVSVCCWRQLGDNVFASLHKGDSVEVRGRMRQREYLDTNNNRVVRYELDAYSVAPDLNRAQVTLERPPRSAPAQAAAMPAGGVVPAQAAPGGSGDTNPWTEPVRPPGEEAA